MSSRGALTSTPPCVNWKTLQSIKSSNCLGSRNQTPFTTPTSLKPPSSDCWLPYWDRSLQNSFTTTSSWHKLPTMHFRIWWIKQEIWASINQTAITQVEPARCKAKIWSYRVLVSKSIKWGTWSIFFRRFFIISNSLDPLSMLIPRKTMHTISGR